METRLQFMLDIIQKMGDFQREHFRTEIEYETKSGALDVVSFVDKECEKMFQEVLKENFPEDAIMGEESFDSNIDYRRYDKLWIVDPLDGTLMYKRGIPTYGPMIAYIENGVIQYSAILLPEMNELYHADVNGAYKNGVSMNVSNTSNLEHTLINVSNKMLTKFAKNTETIMKLFESIGKMSHFYTAATITSYCANGSIDGGFFYITQGNIWDTVPGGFLIQQAGGKVTNFGSDSWNIFNPKVIFSNGLIHAEFQKLLES